MLARCTRWRRVRRIHNGCWKCTGGAKFLVGPTVWLTVATVGFAGVMGRSQPHGGLSA